MTFEAIHKMFERTAERSPRACAVEAGERRLSYRDLDDWSTGLARRLLAAGAQPGDFVAILSLWSVEAIAGILAALKAGCAFVPLDVQFPTARLDAVIEAAHPPYWLVGTELLGKVEAQLAAVAPRPAVLGLGRGDRAGEGKPADGLPGDRLDPDFRCYLYFTSGSTGRPKAIVGRLKGIDHFVRWEVETFGVGEGTRFSQLVSPAFDAFLRDAFTPLCAGGTVCVPAERELIADPERLPAWLDEQRIELVHLTPSLFRVALNQERNGHPLRHLRHVLLAGEPLLPSDVKRWYSRSGSRAELVNLYGPSETTMVKLFHRVTAADGEAKTVPIGKAMPGARAIVIDDQGAACPPGKLGEILIRTPYRSHGYLGQPELTAEAFVPNPFGSDPDDLVYRSGDLGRMREDGSLEFVGRRDQQVKIRGMRLELAAIEQALAQHRQVREAAVVDRTDGQGNKYLCAYLAADGSLDGEAVRRHLAAVLPEPLVPSAIVFLAALPRSLTGKVDRRALPEPDGARASGGGQYLPPRTPGEEELCGLFASLLSLQRVGVRDNFFEIGGHSLLATLLLSRIRSAFGVEVSLRELFREPTVQGLALEVTRLQMEQMPEGSLDSLLAEIEGMSDGGTEAAVERSAAGQAGNGR